MFTKQGHRPFRLLLPGVQMRPLAFEEKTILCEFLLEKGYTLPWHNHPHEQTGYLLSGKMKFRIGDDFHLACRGDSWSIPGNVYHEVFVEEDAHVIELFSPVRSDYLPQKDGETGNSQ